MSKPLVLAILAAVIAFIGGSWLTMLDGQTFTNALGGLACLIVSIGICVLGYRSTSPSLLRPFWFSAIGVLSLACLAIAVQLPRAYRFQDNFNTHGRKTFEIVGKMLANGESR